ncbi:putative Adenosylcobalamin-dependent ribonucleoside-triphosphate reductase [Melia azedarach]|uniref:Adenosylcobalamin-dependent ribonucleoside-triphosphate reductase n=1 Tax=Melia azedarach TaxID=155640 RepID=A0ACC1YVR9_MELAZ|nr:putative Adenosylcobalamin-dependent ribonucleoside-triphosphate reductase [Melia azedarach]
MAALRVNTSLLLFLLLLVPLLSSSPGIIVESFKVDSMLPVYSLHKDDGVGMKMRKLMSFEHGDAVLDYDDAGANQKHDPRKKPGPGGKP